MPGTSLKEKYPVEWPLFIALVFPFQKIVKLLPIQKGGKLSKNRFQRLHKIMPTQLPSSRKFGKLNLSENIFSQIHLKKMTAVRDLFAQTV